MEHIYTIKLFIDSSIIKNEYEKIIRNDKNTNLAESLITIAKIFDKYHQS
jgi:hypothetical protein